MTVRSPYRFLFDECLAVDLVGVANSRGYEAAHVKHVGLLGASDRHLAAWAVATDTVFATNNAKDLRRIYVQFELHPGLIVILPNIRPAEQSRLFALVLDRLATLADTVNVLIEVTADGIVTVANWSRQA